MFLPAAKPTGLRVLRVVVGGGNFDICFFVPKHAKMNVSSLEMTTT